MPIEVMRIGIMKNTLYIGKNQIGLLSGVVSFIFTLYLYNTAFLIADALKIEEFFVSANSFHCCCTSQCPSVLLKSFGLHP